MKFGLVKTQIKMFLKGDNQELAVYFQTPPASKRIPRRPFFISKLKLP